MQIEVPAVAAADLILPGASEDSSTVQERIKQARNIQVERYRKLGIRAVRTNSDCPVSLLQEHVALDGGANALLREAADAMQLSARGFYRTLRVARTLADLDQSESVVRIQVAEALSYRGDLLRHQLAA
jgi:magnesium chelatase family protein